MASSHNKEWSEIVAATDDEITSELLHWSGLSEKWERWEPDYFSDFIQDVAEQCKHIFIEREDWEHDFPGLSGTWYIVKTDDQDKLRMEMRSALARVLWINRREIVARLVKLDTKPTKTY